MRSVPLSHPAQADQFYQEHLDRVSRSFAFCIARLDLPLREHVGLGYLLCRMVDTIEDAEWSSFEAQSAAFDGFDQFMLRAPSASECAVWAQSFPAAIPESERLLLLDASPVFANFHELPSRVRDAMLAPVLSMSAGMRHFMARKAREGRLRLRDLVEVNKYCFFVAGVVGEMLTKLTDGAHLFDAFHFGLFLQKVNLLKDQAGDEKVGRFLIPSRPLVRASLESDAAKAFRYLTSLPLQLESFRLFCAWSLFLGLASLPWIDRAAAEDRALKIPREETFQLLARIEEIISDEEQLRELFTELGGNLKGEARPDLELETSSDSFASLYRGSLSNAEVQALFHGA